jgi:hypothetical protein
MLRLRCREHEINWLAVILAEALVLDLLQLRVCKMPKTCPRGLYRLGEAAEVIIQFPGTYNGAEGRA